MTSAASVVSKSAKRLVHDPQSALRDAYAEIKELRRTVASQARLLSLLAPETHPAAPSLNCVYWLYAQARYHTKSWRQEWGRLQPLLRELGELLAPDLTPIVWERHRNVRRHQWQRGGGTPTELTLNLELKRAKQMLAWAVEAQILKFNPLQAARTVKTREIRETHLRQTDIEAILTACESVRDKRVPEEDDDGRRTKLLTAFVLLCFDSMLRFNEARRFRRDNLTDGNYRVTEAKGGKQRTVTLTPRTLEAVNACSPSPFLFTNPETGELLSECVLRKWFRAACRVAGSDQRAAPGERVVVHTLRHAGASVVV